MFKFTYLKVLLPLCFIGYVFTLCKMLKCYGGDADCICFIVLAFTIVLFGYSLSSVLVKINEEIKEQREELNVDEIASNIFIGKIFRATWIIGYIICGYYFIDSEVLRYLFHWDVKESILSILIVIGALCLLFYLVDHKLLPSLIPKELYDAKVQLLRGISYYAEDNYIKAAKWYRMAAEQGDAGAQFRLGLCYYCGTGVSEDDAEAVKWYMKAAEQGLAEAQSELGHCYMNGEGIAQNYVEAVKCYRKAAEQGYAEAQYRLGCCYYYGNGVEQNEAEAVKWWKKADEQGYKGAGEALERLNEPF